MQAHFGARVIKVNEAGLGRVDVAARRPRLQRQLRDVGPGRVRLGMGWLVAIAARGVRHPAQRSAIGHAHGKRLTGARHARDEQRRGGDNGAQIGHQTLLRVA